MARTSDPHAAAIKAWDTRGRALPGTGSSPTQLRDDYYQRMGWSEPRTFDALSNEKLRAFTSKHFGKMLSRDDLADLAGAPPGSEVGIDTEVGGAGGWRRGSIGVEVQFPDGAGSCYRIIEPAPNGPVIHNQDMTAQKRGTGLGTAVFELEVETAARLGFSAIKVAAVGKADLDRRFNGRQPNGYYTWARLGFESDDPVVGPSGPTKLTELMSQPGGADWWKANGKDFFGTFDLSPDSKSMRVFNEYRRLKRERARDER